MSKLVVIEVAMKLKDPVLHEIYFGKNAIIHYQEPPIYNDEYDVPILVVGMKKTMNKKAATEFLLNCPGFKKYHKILFGKDVKSYITTEDKFKQVEDWYQYFHPKGRYR